MAKTKVKINSAGARELLNSQGVQRELQRQGKLIENNAASMGGTYTSDVQPGKNRAHCRVKTADSEAREQNSKHNSLLKAMR